ncbi:uncharacterized protein RSE6_13095 [Rhynchosporium secalis]|uniref:Uncharacterized protein n=1 Tax=Rhynchosporium secalis TaxID=38038 RepID=A0A1E1MS53_RHYSE|nr:uncharacterized protein RSE6_13095 [Rhynchosporium secalis]
MTSLPVPHRNLPSNPFILAAGTFKFLVTYKDQSLAGSGSGSADAIVVASQVAELVDQHDCIKTARPWLEEWMENETAESLIRRQEGWLFIEWVFGREAIFSDLAIRMANDSQLKKAFGGRIDILLIYGETLSEPMLPGIIGSDPNFHHEAVHRNHPVKPGSEPHEIY